MSPGTVSRPCGNASVSTGIAMNGPSARSRPAHSAWRCATDSGLAGASRPPDLDAAARRASAGVAWPARLAGRHHALPACAMEAGTRKVMAAGNQRACGSA